MKILISLFVSSLLLASSVTAQNQSNSTLYRYYDSINDQCGYQNAAGEMIIPVGKYFVCFSDSIVDYGIVLHSGKGFVAIDRAENILYQVYPFDNGPDYPSEGIFRIVSGDKIGYADEKTGKVIVPPTYTCAEPFQNGVAHVSTFCTKHYDGEHYSWEMYSISIIDKTGTVIDVQSTMPEKAQKKLEKRKKKIKTP